MACIKTSSEAFVRLCLSFYIDLKSGFQFNGAMVVPYCDLLQPAFYKGFIKYCKVRRLVFNEILQFSVVAHHAVQCPLRSAGVFL